MEGARRDLVLRVVAAAVRPEQDVMRLGAAVTAPGHLTEAVVALAHLLRTAEGAPRGILPGVDKVGRDHGEARPGRERAPDPLAHGVDGGGEERRHATRERDHDLPRRTQLPLALTGGSAFG